MKTPASARRAFTWIFIPSLLLGCTTPPLATETPSPLSSASMSPQPFLTGNPATAFQPVRIPGTEDAEATTVVLMSIANYEKIKDKITVYESLYSSAGGLAEFIKFLDDKEMRELQKNHPEIPWTSYAVPETTDSFRICMRDYNKLREDLSLLSLKKTDDHEIFLRIKSSDLKIIPPEMIYISRAVRKDGFLVLRRNIDEVSLAHLCFADASPNELLMSAALEWVYDPTLYALNLPPELKSEPVAPDQAALYLIKLRPELLENLSKEDATNLSPIPHEALNYDLFSNASPYSLVIVSTTENTIKNAKNAGIVWWYEQYHPAYKKDIQYLYSSNLRSGDGYGLNKYVSIQLMVYFPEGITEEAVTAKRGELEQMAKAAGADFYLKSVGDRLSVATFDTYRAEGDRYYGIVEPRAEIKVPWETYSGAYLFPFLLPKVPQDQIFQFLKRNDVFEVKMQEIPPHPSKPDFGW